MPRKKKPARTEEQIAAALVEHLESLGYDVYQEVCPSGSRSVADIVFVNQKKQTFIVEVKRRLNMTLLVQAMNWMEPPRADGVFVAFEPPTRGPSRDQSDTAAYAVSKLGIGVFEVKDHVFRTHQPKLNENLYKPIHEELRPEHKTWAKAGTPGGGYYTKFQGTCKAAFDFISENGPTTLSELERSISHHYASRSSALRCLAGLMREGVVKGLTLDESEATGSMGMVRKS